MKKLSECELSYLAGFFDGEGSIIYARRRSQHSDLPYYYAVEVQLGQCDEYHPMLSKLYFGGCITIRKAMGNWKEAWCWRVASKQAYLFLKEITPYLRLKKPQAELAMKIQESKFKRNYRKRTEEQAALEEADRILMQSLNDKSNCPGGAIPPLVDRDS